MSEIGRKRERVKEREIGNGGPEKGLGGIGYPLTWGRQRLVGIGAWGPLT